LPVTIGHPVERLASMLDICSGWAADGLAASAVRQEHAELVINGPAAPSLDDDIRPWAWHEMPPLVPHSMRRLRRIDLLPRINPSVPRQVASFFRDSAVLESGAHTVIHEYGVNAELDAECVRVMGTVVRPRVLPFRDCSRAAASSSALDGEEVTALRERARSSLRGVGSCTHLTDTLAVLADVRALVAVDPAGQLGK
jgi:hypothetical protein